MVNAHFNTLAGSWEIVVTESYDLREELKGNGYLFNQAALLFCEDGSVDEVSAWVKTIPSEQDAVLREIGFLTINQIPIVGEMGRRIYNRGVLTEAQKFAEHRERHRPEREARKALIAAQKEERLNKTISLAEQVNSESEIALLNWWQTKLED